VAPPAGPPAGAAAARCAQPAGPAAARTQEGITPVDMQERAAKWINDHVLAPETLTGTMRQHLISAYLAGAAQAQRDYTDYYAAQGAIRAQRHR